MLFVIFTVSNGFDIRSWNGLFIDFPTYRFIRRLLFRLLGCLEKCYGSGQVDVFLFLFHTAGSYPVVMCRDN